MFFLFNVELCTKLATSGNGEEVYRLPFHLHKNTNYDIEHIDSKIDKEVKDLNEIEKIEPNYKYLHSRKAGLFLYANKYLDAKAEINKELKNDSLNAEFWMLKGIITRKLKEIEYSNRCFKNSLKFYKLGKSYSFKNENTSATISYYSIKN